VTRVAAIDIGTNSVRLLVAEERPPGFRDVDRRLTITRLGEGVDRSGSLGEQAIARTLTCVAEYAAICGELAVEKMRVTGTSAVRDANNRGQLFDGIRRLTGSEAEVLSGDDEARLTFIGARADLAGSDPVLLVDIGGGSTELVYGADAPQEGVSLDIGCVRLFERHLASDPPTEDELGALRADVIGALEAVRTKFEIPPSTRLVGVAGTVTQLAALKAGIPVYDPDVTHHAVLSHGDVRMLARRLSTLSFEQRKQVRGLQPGRADVIVAGTEILLAVMETFDAAEVIVSEKDILDGLVYELLDPDISETP
jgi:exopolyphosphatase/guanosine-5'-triphosphate,3'-diphosphate pyrophosphatase